jgi:polysaccharide export outer membrane protein
LGSQTLLDVIAAAGGTTPFAGPEVTIRRSADSNFITVRLSKDAQASLTSDVRLYPGDKIVVPRAGLVYVLGDVGRPGGFVMENDGRLTLLEALAMAGGSNRTASLSHARLIRKTATGYSDVPIFLKKIIRGEDAAPQLQTEDILYIPNNAVKSALTQQVPSALSAASGAAIYHSMP